MRLNEIDKKSWGYVSVKPTDEAQKIIQTLIKKCNVPDPIPMDELHVTLMYDPDNSITRDNIDDLKDDSVLSGKVESAGYLGEGKWAALVLHLDSEDLQDRHNELKEMGLTFSYDDYLPHMSLCYGKEEGEIDDVLKSVQEYVQNNTLMLEFTNEHWASTDD